MAVLKKRKIETPAYPELFEDLRDLIGCEYISDLTARYNTSTQFNIWTGSESTATYHYRCTVKAYESKDARRIAGTISLERYPVSLLNDLYEYLYGEKKTFPDICAASEAFATPRTGLFRK